MSTATVTPEQIRSALKQDRYLRDLFGKAEFWRGLSRMDSLPQEMRQEANDHARAAYAEAEKRYHQLADPGKREYLRMAGRACAWMPERTEDWPEEIAVIGCRNFYGW